MGSIHITLNRKELQSLNRPINGCGGFQGLLATLRYRAGNSGVLTLTDTELGRINRYAFRYSNGGWQGRLTSIFGRHLWEQ